MDKRRIMPVVMQNVPRNLPPFVGRSRELAEISQLLTRPDCRLLTLVGVGGSGKTRLAIEAAEAVSGEFTDGAIYVPLATINSPERVAPAISHAARLTLSSPEEPGVQLMHYLRGKRLLLLLDSFESLLPDVELILELLENAPELTLLVTSRQVLNLREEWQFVVTGMDFPPADAAPDTLASFDAVQLFLHHAERMRRDVSLADDGPAIAHICRVVQGLPLALELAAAWSNMLALDEIAAEIQSNLDILEANLRDFPDRHRSIRAVFDQSWNHLNEQERLAFMRLSIFRGGFGREAAKAVAGVSLPRLSSLVDKSLLYHQPGGRYTMHELLRQYAEERLATMPDEAERLLAAHAAYYARFLAGELGAVVSGDKPRQTFARLNAEMDNIRLAWPRLVTDIRPTTTRLAVYTVGDFMQLTNQFVEMSHLYEEAVARLENLPPSPDQQEVLVEVLSSLAWFYVRLGQLDEAEAAARRSADIFAEQDIPVMDGIANDPLNPLTIVLTLRGEYEAALQTGQAALSRSQSRKDEGNRSAACYVLSSAALAAGMLEPAQKYARQSVELAEAMGTNWFRGYCLVQLGNVLVALGRYTEAQEVYQTCLEIDAMLAHAEGLAVVLGHLGKVALWLDDPDAAIDYFARSLDNYQGLSDPGGLVNALHGLGTAYRVKRRFQDAQLHLLKSLHLALECQLVTRTLNLGLELGELLAQTGAVAKGRRLIQMVKQHPSTDHETRRIAARYLKRMEEGLAPDEGPTPDEETRAGLEELLRMAEQELRQRPRENEVAEEADDPNAALVEPLSERELEILQLVADGYTNQQIADELIIAIGTVKAHNHSIYTKLGVSNRIRAVARARQAGLVT